MSGEANHRDDRGSRMGMWFFLLSELMLFSGLFLLYAVYLTRYPQEFIAAAAELSTPLGTTNTLVLLTSSLFAACAVTAIQRDRRQTAALLIGVTLLCALLFLGIKYVEWSTKFGHGIYPNSPILNARPHGEIIFFGLYFTITGLHALHVLVGAALLGVSAVMAARGSLHAGRYVLLENSALYWHLVDLVWIFIFPLFYLIV